MTIMLEAANYAGSRWKDYLELCKPRVVALMLLTSVIGMLLATPHMVPWQIMLL